MRASIVELRVGDGPSATRGSRSARYHGAMALKKMVERLTKPVEELDREELTAFCDARHSRRWTRSRPGSRCGSAARCDRCGSCPVRAPPRSRSRSATAAARWSACSSAGARSPGCRRAAQVALEGVAARDGKRYLVFNPVYELLELSGSSGGRSGRRAGEDRRDLVLGVGRHHRQHLVAGLEDVSPRGITTCSSRTTATIVASRGTSRSLIAWSMTGESSASVTSTSRA